MKAKVNLQRDVYGNMLRAHANFKKSPKERISESYVLTRLEILDQLWGRFMQVHHDIISEAADWEDLQKSAYVTEHWFEETEELYIKYKCDLMKYKSQEVTIQKSENCSNGNQSHSSLQLPKITIPTFSGKYNEWITFRDLFRSLVDSNTSIDDVQKLHYLKTYLTGEAEQLIRQLPITAGNYRECWNQLEKRYNNKNYMANCLLKQLINQKSTATESSVYLKELIDTTVDCLHGLQNIGVDVESWDVIVIHIVANKLDSETRKQWELKVAGESANELPKFTAFRDFLQNRFRALECIEPNSRPRPSNPTHGKPTKHNVWHVTSVTCEYCTSDHRLYSCKQFAKEEVGKRRDFVYNNSLCYNCLGSNHSARSCPSNWTCKICKGKHHSLLHPHSGSGGGNPRGTNSSPSGVGVVGSSTKNSVASSSSVEAAPVVTCFGQVPVKKQIFLATAVVLAKTSKGRTHCIRALLDQGSQASFVSEATAQYLGLKRYPVKGIISGLEGNKTTVAKHMVEFEIRSRICHDIVIKVKAYVLKSITTYLPTCKVEEVNWLEEDMYLADPQYHTPNRIDILLGAEIYGQVIQGGIRKGPQGYPLAQATSLGWILSGLTQDSHSSSDNAVTMHLSVEDDGSCQCRSLKRFWEMEAEPTSQKRIMTEEEARCEQHFDETHERDADGRYVVRLPFKTEIPECVGGDSRAIAEKRLNGLQTRFKRNAELKERYKEVFEQYLDLKFMERVPESEKDFSRAVYLPHHPVLRDDKDTTKLRIVYDASCKNKNGVALNDALMTGPTLQPDLRHLLMRWRLHPICMAADVIKMYCQVKISKEDADYQRLLWKENSEEKAEDYRLLRVTFGTAAAPYLAVKSLQQVAHDEGAAYPMASERVINDFYMDDLLTGCSSEKEGMIIYKEMNDLLKKGGFELQKWISNSDELLQAIKETETRKDDVQEELKLKMDEIVKLLGLSWNRRTDDFRYSVTLPLEPGPVTKRKVLSHIARLYDPLGWAAPCVIVAKVLIQKLWIAGLDWDDEVSSKLADEWNTYREELPKLTHVTIPRWLGTNLNDALVELHGFSDASKTAFAAAVYLRRIDATGSVHVALVTAKTRVAPIKQVSIPRLELCGAVMLTRLLVEVANTLKIDKLNIRAWTDSTVVLAWINSHPSRWQTFIANRVSEILTKLESNQWSHVSSGQNPADCASRGITPTELLKSSMWFNGPDFLRNDIVKLSKPKDIDTHLEEIKVHVAVSEIPMWNKYSTLTKLVRVVAYCRRVLLLRKPVSERQCKDYLTSLELTESLEVCVKHCQTECFAEELAVLRRDDKCSNIKGPLKSLSPFIDHRDVLRVGGRLGKSFMSENVKHPILLPKGSKFTELIIADAHAKTLHGGIQLMMAYLSTKYFILGAKPLIKAYVRKCVVCIRHNAKTSTQLMGQLPAVRGTPNRAFKCSGVDFAGPILVRTTKGRGHHASKGYICLFVCMATRAVHLEAVSDLTTQGFLAAFKRFVARRGHCSDLWSDNGKNFVGASRELQVLFASENSGILKEVATSLSSNGTTWHFIPPHSPNFGGLWEAGIKSTKFHLKRVIGETTLTYEELSTVLAQIEACLNSRPLSRLDSESDTMVEVLTPGHFLVGEPIITAPDHNYETSNITSLRRWQLIQKMLQGFWRRWSHEYLTKFLHRYKWSHQNPEPAVGDIVLVKEDDLPPSRWLLGRVITKHPGSDDITRVVTLRTKGSVIKRPTCKLIVLPVSV